jgi:hypothetical protein
MPTAMGCFIASPSSVPQFLRLTKPWYHRRIVSEQLFKAPLTGTFKPSRYLLLTADEMTLFWTLVTVKGGDPGTVVEWYLEFTDNPVVKNATWFREVDEQDTGLGVVKMSKAVRTFNENNASTGLQDGTHLLSTQLVRKAPFGRVQARVTAGAATATITTPSGSTPPAPAS